MSTGYQVQQRGSIDGQDWSLSGEQSTFLTDELGRQGYWVIAPNHRDPLIANGHLDTLEVPVMYQTGSAGLGVPPILPGPTSIPSGTRRSTSNRWPF